MNVHALAGRPTVGLATTLLLVGCTAGASPSPAPAAVTAPAIPAPIATPAPSPTLDRAPAASPGGSDPAPIHAVPGGAEAVWGSAACEALEGEGLVLECELDMSDPRVSGTEMLDDFRGAGRLWTFGRDVITNAEGTWRGSSQGADDLAGNPAGESRFVGEGAYEGLEFHYYVIEPGFLEGARLTGWITESTPADTASAAAPVTPFHALPVGTVPVSGTAACDATGSGAVDPTGELDVLLTCRLDLSDPRVSGTETQDRFRVLAGRVGAGDVRVADDARIATDGGTWRGSIQAATDDASVPVPIGEAHYVGEGAYEGLEFHYYFAAVDIAKDGVVRVHGWISPAE